MRQLTRLVRYVLPFLLQLFPGIVLLAAVGFLEAFRLILLKPMLDRVLNPASGSENILLFNMPQSGHADLSATLRSLLIFTMPGALSPMRWWLPRC